MAMIRMRHPTMRFNFTAPGEVFETTDDCVEYLISEYGCEVVGEEKPKPAPVYAATTTEDDVPEVEEMIEAVEKFAQGAEEVTDVVINGDDVPLKLKAGWWEWQGKKYRKANLPAEALALLE